MYTIDVQSTGGTFSGGVTLSVTGGLPAGATANFSPNPVILGATPSLANPAAVVAPNGSSILNVQTAGTQTAAARARRWLLITPALGLVLLPFRRRGKQYRLKLLVLLALLGIAVSMVACGGGSALTQSHTYTLQVTGTSGAIQQTTTVQLTVQ